MDTQRKLRLINELVDNVKADIIKEVSKMPEEWNGIELRWYISEKFAEVVFGGWHDKRTKRYREYWNFCITKPL